MKVFGITGSIATGKSTVTKYLIEKGYQVIDSDKLAYEALTKDDDCINKVKELFKCLDDYGNIDRIALGKIIFKDKDAKKRLEDIIHPYVIKEIKRFIEVNRYEDIIFLDIPLLYECKLEYLCDQIIVVYIDEAVQLKRLMNRDNIDEKYARMIMSNQMSIEEKKKKANIVIDNCKDLISLYQQIDKVLEK